MDEEIEVKQKILSSQFQNRLVGVIVLVALGVIFLPDILDGKKQQQEEQFSEIPLRPAVEANLDTSSDFEAIDLTDEAAQFSAAEPEVPPIDTTPSNVTATEPQAKPPKPVKVEQSVPSGAYTLQLGSFKNAANVNALVKRLRDKGFRAYTLPQKPVDGELTKVFVGPDISKAKLQRLQKELDKLTELKSAVVSYNPVE
ncbi:SPOR domain-containing protein [Shewanella algidipiscicola]|uniref:Cell division protein DedD n=1 Tax=Shewanella algidipiscicola TaxID=614070 RepID=A0ABQ4PNQ4_9GAMM|nr:SPOR domain-containing protein [Shewanella algidipiscicola]GIU50094.1 cell division protein DedD [Shewanella algidipiscicola]